MFLELILDIKQSDFDAFQRHVTLKHVKSTPYFLTFLGIGFTVALILVTQDVVDWIPPEFWYAVVALAAGWLLSTWYISYRLARGVRLNPDGFVLGRQAISFTPQGIRTKKP